MTPLRNARLTFQALRSGASVRALLSEARTLADPASGYVFRHGNHENIFHKALAPYAQKT